MQNTHRNNHLELSKYSAYPGEEEILLHDGLKFIVFDQYYDKEKEITFIKLYNTSKPDKVSANSSKDVYFDQ